MLTGKRHELALHHHLFGPNLERIIGGILSGVKLLTYITNTKKLARYGL